MKGSRIAVIMCMLVVATAPSCDREDTANLAKEASSALTARGMAVGAFKQVSNYQVATRDREQVQCAEVSRNASDCRVCVISYKDADAALSAVNSKIRTTLPVGSAYFVRGKTIFVVEPGARRSDSLIQEVHDELTKLP